MLHELQVDPDIRKAWTIPSAFYTDPSLYEQSKRQIFANSWQWAGWGAQIKTPGSVLPFTLLEGCLDEPLLWSRDRDDQIHCLSNVCTHRGNLVCEGAGHANSLRCRYHGRRFGLDGSFQSMPEFEGVENFPAQSDHLPKVTFAEWQSLLFARVSPTGPSMEEYMQGVTERISFLPLDQFIHAPERARDYLVNGHWALYVDNYLEGFHIPYIHAALNATLDYGSYRTILLPHGNLQVGAASDGEHVFDLPPGHPEHGERISAFYFWMFPNLMLNFYPWGLSLNLVQPLSHERTKVSFVPFVWRPEYLDQGSGGALDRVEREDEVVVELTQRGVRSRFYDRGRYSPVRELGVHQFHRMISEAMNG
ncbi:MAG: aromatic ring-hydroxylating dioxygenase subunit alpha [Armatimonadetes bacterium]|nr:aromatic ring-hydroxylating dioxygenase subunit alpha [Armatimonadota bacterium]